MSELLSGKEDIKTFIQIFLFLLIINFIQLVLIYYAKHLSGVYRFTGIIGIILVVIFIIFLAIQITYLMFYPISDNFSIVDLIILLSFLGLICILVIILII